MNPSPENTSALAQFLAEPGEDKQSSEFDKKRALELLKAGWPPIKLRTATMTHTTLC